MHSRTRQDHLTWCKSRAIIEMDYYNDPSQAIISMMSDLRKHPETNDEILVALLAGQLPKSKQMSRQEIISLLNGFK